MAKLPAIQFYPADWRKDPGVQSLTYHQRGVWFEIICLMHESPRRGVLLMPNGKSMTDEVLGRILGLDKQNITTTLTAILECGVADREPETEALTNRRMIRDEELRQTRAKCGKLGGNPILLNQKVNQKPTTQLNQNPTPSSSSSTTVNTLSIPREEEAMELAKTNPGWTVDVVKQWFLERSSQGWVKGSGVPITNWRADLEAWVLRQAQGISPSSENRRNNRNQPQKPARTSKFAFEIPNHNHEQV
jgi:hypothetical protein